MIYSPNCKLYENYEHLFMSENYCFNEWNSTYVYAIWLNTQITITKIHCNWLQTWSHRLFLHQCDTVVNWLLYCLYTLSGQCLYTISGQCLYTISGQCLYTLSGQCVYTISGQCLYTIAGQCLYTISGQCL